MGFADEAATGLNGPVDGLISAPHVPSSLCSDISQLLAQSNDSPVGSTPLFFVEFGLGYRRL